MKGYNKNIFGMKYAVAGIIKLLKSERNMRVHCCAAIITVISGFLLKLTSGEWIAVILCIGTVMSAEAFNTAIEKLADIVCDRHNPAIAAVKDIAAGGVLIVSLMSAAVGVAIFFSKLN